MQRKPPPGKKAEPAAEELEFIHSRLQRLSDSEILEEMQETEFPLRKSGFIKRRRKEFGVAKKVLTEQIARDQDPLLVEARRTHFTSLKEFVVRWEQRLDATPEYVVGFVQEVLAATLGSGPKTILLNPTTAAVQLTFIRSEDESAAITVIAAIERDRLYHCLKSHLLTDAYQRLWNDWDSLPHEVCRGIAAILSEFHGGEASHSAAFKVALAEEKHKLEMWCFELGSYLQEIRLREIVAGTCDLCPDKAITKDSLDRVARRFHSARSFEVAFDREENQWIIE